MLEGNDKSAPSAPEPSVSLVTTGPGEDGRFFNVSGEVTISSGFGQGQEGVGLVRSLDENCSEACAQPFHQWHIVGVPRANFARSAHDASAWLPRGSLSPSGAMIDGAPIYTFSLHAAGSVQVIELDMSTTPALAGQLTYFAVRTTAAAGALRLAIDRGDGKWRYSATAASAAVVAVAASDGEKRPEWRVESFAAVLSRSGAARFAVVPPASPSGVRVAQAVVARVGAGWSDVAFV